MINKLKQYFKYWNTDIGFRYLPIASHLKNEGLDKGKILEVGSGDQGITPYLKKKVIGLDVNFSESSPFLTQIAGSVTNLPFKDRDFDVVISVDMLEHIPRGDRGKAVIEIIRVAGKKAIIAVPCGDKLDEAVKIYAEAFYKKYGYLHRWLKEHAENPSPAKEEISDAINEAARLLRRPIRIKVKKNVNVKLWLFFNLAGISKIKLLSYFGKGMVLLYPLLKLFMNWGECIRQVFYIEFVDVRERIDAGSEPADITRYEHLFRYKFACKQAGKRVLDLGCGYGYGAQMLYKEGREVVGMDISKEAIAYARNNYPGPEYLMGSADKIPYPDDYFDSVVAFEVIEHIEEPNALLSEAYRVLKKEGSLFISTPNPMRLGNILKHYLKGVPWPEKAHLENIFHLKEYPYCQFMDLLKGKKFEVKQRFGQTINFAFGWIWEILKFNKIYSKFSIYLGYFFPQISEFIVVEAKKI